jgi:hypothetical protein
VVPFLYGNLISSSALARAEGALMTDKHITYKGERAKIIMMGHKQKVPGWRGELYVAVIQYGANFDVLPDSTEAADQADLPEVQTFTDRSQAIAHFMKLEQNKKQWK